VRAEKARMFNIHQSSFLGPSAHLAAKSWPVALISAPFASLSSPSIQLGLLKAVAEQYGFPVTSFHLYLDFAKYISRSEYTKIADSGPLLVGEWLFSVEAFGDEAPDAAEALLSGRLSEYDKFLADPNLGPTRLSDMRRHIIPAYLNEVAASIDWREFKLVGFSSTFQQTTASIAFARRIKLANPDVVLVFGGANAEATMGLEIARSVELFDFVVSGEGDQTLPDAKYVKTRA
jgi:hypothetical protein